MLLLDEPFTFLDPAGQETFAAVIRRLRSRRGVTIVTVTHDLARAEARPGWFATGSPFVDPIME